MKQLFVILLIMYGFTSPPLFAETTIPACGDMVSANENPKPDEEEEEPDCD